MSCGALRPCHSPPRPSAPLCSRSQSAQALTFDDIQGLTYLQVKGSGIANTCPVIDAGSTNLKDLKAGTYKCVHALLAALQPLRCS